MKTLNDYTDKKITSLMEECGAFFAFSGEQFNESSEKGFKYVNCGGGLITKKDKAPELLKKMKEIYAEGREEDLKDNGKEKIILRELLNYEAFYVYCIEDTIDALESYQNISKEDILKVFNQNKDKYSE